MPRSVVRKSRAIDKRLQGTNRRENSLAFAEYVRQFEPAYIDFALQNPSIIALKIYRSYELFWLPIRYYGGMYLSLFEVDRVIKRSLNIESILHHWLSGQLPEAQWLITGKYGDFETRPATMFTVDLLSPLIAVLALVAIHLFLPYQCLKEGCLWLRDRRITSRRLTLLTLALVIGYSFFVFVVVEHGENMRFRLAIEPVIWLCMLWMLAAAIAAGRRGLASIRERKLRNGAA